MGFDSARVDWALRSTGSSGLQQALDHLEANQDTPVPDPSAQSAPAVASSTNEDDYDAEDQAALADMLGKKGQAAQDQMMAGAAEAKSIKCMDCGKMLRSADFASYHAEKSGHTNFEESTEEIKPLSEEEKKARLEEMRSKLAAKKAAQAKIDAEEARANEKIRRKAGQDLGMAKEELKKKDADLLSSSLAPVSLSSSPSPSASHGFVFPPMHRFPPFFTVQPNPSAWSSQLSTWTKLILDYCRHRRLFHLDAQGQWERSGADGLFRNVEIARALDGTAIRKVLEGMVESGDAGWDPAPPARPRPGAAPPSRALIYWRRPAEWGELIVNWVNETGQNGSILTLFELTEGDEVQGTEFGNLPLELMRRALATLVRTGRAQMFEGSEMGGEGEGVKFL